MTFGRGRAMPRSTSRGWLRTWRTRGWPTRARGLWWWISPGRGIPRSFPPASSASPTGRRCTPPRIWEPFWTGRRSTAPPNTFTSRTSGRSCTLSRCFGWPRWRAMLRKARLWSISCLVPWTARTGSLLRPGRAASCGWRTWWRILMTRCMSGLWRTARFPTTRPELRRGSSGWRR